MDKHILRSDGVKSNGQTNMRWTNKRSNNGTNKRDKQIKWDFQGKMPDFRYYSSSFTVKYS